MPECICVPKVFDWVLVSEDIGNFTFTVPACHGFLCHVRQPEHPHLYGSNQRNL
jgi:hypothetical protein